jgi:hypothetical protein
MVLIGTASNKPATCPTQLVIRKVGLLGVKCSVHLAIQGTSRGVHMGAHTETCLIEGEMRNRGQV